MNLSAYEIQRQQTIARNQEMLKQLGLVQEPKKVILKLNLLFS